MANVLKQTLRVASGIVFALVEVSPSVAAVQGTVATLADGLDGTGSAITASDDVDIGVGGASGNYREEWTLDPATSAGTHAFIRIVSRTDRVGSPALGIAARYQPSIDGVSRGTLHDVFAAEDDAQQFTLDPADGLPWTNAKLNAQKFGWYLEAGAAGAPLSLDAVCTCAVVDFRVEVWGEDVSGASTTEIAGVVDVVGEGVLGSDGMAGGDLGETGSGELPSPVVGGGVIGVVGEGRIFKG